MDLAPNFTNPKAIARAAPPDPKIIQSFPFNETPFCSIALVNPIQSVLYPFPSWTQFTAPMVCADSSNSFKNGMTDCL